MREGGGGGVDKKRERSRRGYKNEERGKQETVPGEIKRSRDLEEGGGAGLRKTERKLDFFRFELFLNSGATDIVFVTLPKHGS